MQRMLQLLVEAGQQMHVSMPLELPGLEALSEAGRWYIYLWSFCFPMVVTLPNCRDATFVSPFLRHLCCSEKTQYASDLLANYSRRSQRSPLHRLYVNVNSEEDFSNLLFAKCMLLCWWSGTENGSPLGRSRSNWTGCQMTTLSSPPKAPLPLPYSISQV